MTWQPIETAPKDGTAVLVYGDGAFVGAPNTGVREWVQLTENYGRWFEPNISAHESDDWLDGRTVYSNLTHWMPLPAPPLADRVEGVG